MEMLKQLVKHVLTEDGPIALMTDDERYKVYFSQAPVYEARYVTGLFEDTRTGVVERDPRLIAIVSKGTVYLTGQLRIITIHEWSDLENGVVEHVMTLGQKIEQLNEEAAGPIFQGFLDGIPDDPVKLEGWRIRFARERARKMALGILSEPLVQPPKKILDEDTVYKIVNGQIDLRTAAIKALTKDTGHWVQEKASARKTQEFLSDEDLTEPWERKMAKALDIPAKAVIIEAAHDGHISSGQVYRSMLLTKLAAVDHLSSYDFPSAKAGAQFFGALDLDLIYCRDITKIVFRGKTLYERTDN